MSEPVFVAYIAAMAAAIGAVIGAISNVFVGWLMQRRQAKTTESEERRWYLDYFVPRKLEALGNLYAALVNYSLAFPNGLVGFEKDYYFQKIKPTQDAFVKANALALLYLDDQGLKLMTDIEQDIPTVNLVVLQSQGNMVSFDSTQIHKRAQEGLEYLRKFLNPKTLEQIENQTW